MNEFAVERPTRLVDTHARLIDEDDLLATVPQKSGTPRAAASRSTACSGERDPCQLCCHPGTLLRAKSVPPKTGMMAYRCCAPPNRLAELPRWS